MLIIEAQNFIIILVKALLFKYIISAKKTLQANSAA